MPSFDVLCPVHGTHEILVKDGEKLACPICGGDAARVWSGADVARFTFKGKGFYANDYGTGPFRMH